jgi:hypothetical protein
MPEESPADAGRGGIVHLLQAAAHALRSYENGNDSPELAASVATAIEQRLQRRVIETIVAFGDGFVLGLMEGPTEAMLAAGECVIEGAPELTTRELGRQVVEAIATQGVDDYMAARRAEIERAPR